MASWNIPRIKICCIASVEEAWIAIRHGASAVGLVSEMPSGPGVIPEGRIAEIAAVIPPGVDTFLLTSKQSPGEIVRQQRRTGVNTIQIVDRFPLDGYKSLSEELPGVRIVQVIHVGGEEAVNEAREVAPHVDALLLDSGNPNLRVKVLGGTGRVHDWAISRRIRESVDIPVFLAGGLKPENVAAAIRQVQPYAVDVCSGVRTEGKLDEHKLAALFVSARTANR